MRIFRNVSLALGFALISGCVVEGGKDVPPVKGNDPVIVDPSTQQVSLNSEMVPVLDSCQEGQYVRKNGNGWICDATTVNPNSLTESDIPWAAKASDMTTVQSRVSTLETSMTSAKNDIASSKSDIASLQNRVTPLEDKMTSVQGDLNTAKSNISGLQNDVSSLNTSISLANSNISAIKNYFRAWSAYNGGATRATNIRVATFSFNSPDSGYALVIANFILAPSDNSGYSCEMATILSDSVSTPPISGGDCPTCPDGYSHFVGSVLNYNEVFQSVRRIFPIKQGTNSFYLNGTNTCDDGWWRNIQFTALYITDNQTASISLGN